MKKALVLSLLVGAGVAGATLAQQPPAQGKTGGGAMPRETVDMARYKTALTDARRKLFAAGMSNLTPQQLESFWAVYGDYEKEKDAITSARMDLAKKYVDAYTSAEGLTDADLTQIVNDAGALQKKNTDLRLKYFGIYSQKLNTKAAARFALIDDYITTAMRLSVLDQIPVPGDEGKK